MRRVEEVLDRISEDRPVTAGNWLEGLFELVDTLSELPERGRVVPELQRSDIRELQYRGYRLVYRVGDNRVGILTLKHGRQRLSLDDDPPGMVREPFLPASGEPVAYMIRIDDEDTAEVATMDRQARARRALRK